MCWKKNELTLQSPTQLAS